MADTKITALAAIGANPIIPSTFPLPMVDLTDTSMAASGTTKKVTVNQILGAGGTATLASATITGDLTVDTNVLKVDSTLNRVGIGTASPVAGSSLDVRGAVGTGIEIQSLVVTDTSPLAINNGGGISFGYVFQSPSTAIFRAGSIKTIKENATDGDYASAMVFSVTSNGVATAERLRINSSGNLGLGVTPSAWATLNPVFQLGGGGTFLAARSTNPEMYIGTNAHFNGTNWLYKTSNVASYYAQDTGVHKWFTAPSGTANTTTITSGVSYTIITSGNQTAFGAANNNVGTVFTATSSGTLSSGTVSQIITFTQAMTLDASGFLGIATANPTNRLTIGTGSFNGATASGTSDLYTNPNGFVVLADGYFMATRSGVNRFIVDTSGNIISNLTSTAPTLSDNGFMVFNLTSNTNLRISVRGTDGTTRTANITLA